MKTTVTDPTFGRLKFDVLWEGKATTATLGRSVPVRIEPDSDDGPPSQAQRRAFESFLSSERTLTGEVEAAIFKYYNRVKKVYRAARDAEWTAEAMPDLERQSDIWNLLDTPSIFVPVGQDKGPVVKLQWNCTWDIEHGLQVTLRNGRVVNVGVQE